MQLPAFFGRKKAINLLPKDSFESSQLGIVLTWLLSFGKWSVIITQLLVMGTFLWRFGLDRELTDLKKQIAKNVSIIKSYEQIERSFVLTQKRLAAASAAITTQEKVGEELAVLQQITPNDVWYDKVSVSPTTTVLTGYSGSLNGFSQLITLLQADTRYSSVAVTKIQDGGVQGSKMQFEINLARKEASKESKKDAAK